MFGPTPDAELQVLLVTSRQTRRWIIPKGHVDLHMSPHQAAAQEALEEAGVVGEISREPLGTFRYAKLLPSGVTMNAKVVVFPLAVSRELDDWLEKDLRERRWFTPQDAVEAVQELALAEIIRKFRGRR